MRLPLGFSCDDSLAPTDPTQQEQWSYLSCYCTSVAISLGFESWSELQNAPLLEWHEPSFHHNVLCFAQALSMYSSNLITVGAIQWTKTVKISFYWGHCNDPVSLLLATLKLAQLFHPLKLSSTIGNYVSNSSTCFLCPLPSPHPLSLLHCSRLHWMLVRVCVSCGCDFYFCNPAS